MVGRLNKIKETLEEKISSFSKRFAITAAAATFLFAPMQAKGSETVFTEDFSSPAALENFTSYGDANWQVTNGMLQASGGEGMLIYDKSANLPSTFNFEFDSIFNSQSVGSMLNFHSERTH